VTRYVLILAGGLKDWQFNSKALSLFQLGFGKGQTTTDNIL